MSFGKCQPFYLSLNVLIAQYLAKIVSHVTAWCPTAPSHYLNQHKFVTPQVLWHSHMGNFIGYSRFIISIGWGNDLVLDRQQAITLTHQGRVTHICISNLTIIGSENGLSPGRCQSIMCLFFNAGMLVTGYLKTNFSEILIEIQTFSFKKKHLKVSSEKWRPFCVGLNESTKNHDTIRHHWATMSQVYHYFSQWQKS